MKKRIMNFVLALTLVLAGTIGATASVKANETAKDWMTFTYNGGSETDFTAKVADGFTPFSDVMPGDTITYKIKYVNGHDKTASFYMNAEVVKSLERANKEVGGAYSYTITNNGQELFSNNSVGGDSTEKLGLTQVSGDTGLYFTLGDVPASGEGTVAVSITLDGDTQANIYKDKIAELQFFFRAESEALGNKVIIKENEKVNTSTSVVKESGTKTVKKQVVKTLDNGAEVVQIDDSSVPLAANDTTVLNDSTNANINTPVTGDSILPLLACVVAFLSGVVLIIYYFKLKADKKREVA